MISSMPISFTFRKALALTMSIVMFYSALYAEINPAEKGDQRRIEKKVKVIEKLVSQKKLEQAHTQLTSVDTTSDHRLQRLAALVEQNRSEANQLVARGDRLWESNPKEARTLYKQALQLNAEIPDVSKKMQVTQMVEKRKPSKSRRTLYIVGILVAIGGGIAGLVILNRKVCESGRCS